MTLPNVSHKRHPLEWSTVCRSQTHHCVGLTESTMDSSLFDFLSQIIRPGRWQHSHQNAKSPLLGRQSVKRRARGVCSGLKGFCSSPTITATHDISMIIVSTRKPSCLSDYTTLASSVSHEDQVTTSIQFDQRAAFSFLSQPKEGSHYSKSLCQSRKAVYAAVLPSFHVLTVIRPQMETFWQDVSSGASTVTNGR